MRILKLTSQTEASLMKLREGQDREAQRIAANIVADVRKHGDSALDKWSGKLDGRDVRGKRLWVAPQEIVAAAKRVDRSFLRAVEHAAANVRRVAEKQLPRQWSLQVEPGVTITQIVRPVDAIYSAHDCNSCSGRRCESYRCGLPARK
jgi:histidinol dehydrogenase